MKKCILYSITIYLILSMIVILKRPSIILDNDGNVKSWTYFKDKIFNGFSDPLDLVCLPTIMMLLSILSFYMARYLIDDTKI